MKFNIRNLGHALLSVFAFAQLANATPPVKNPYSCERQAYLASLPDAQLCKKIESFRYGQCKSMILTDQSNSSDPHEYGDESYLDSFHESFDFQTLEIYAGRRVVFSQDFEQSDKRRTFKRACTALRQTLTACGCKKPTPRPRPRRY